MLNTMLIQYNEKDAKFKVCDHIRISKLKIFLLKDILQIGQKFLLLAKLKKTIPWTHIINDLNGEEIIGGFYEKELQKTN